MSTRAEILAEIAAQFPDNTTGLITPAKLRQVVEDVTNSCLVSDTDAGTAGIAVLQSETAAQGRTALGVESSSSYTTAALYALSASVRPAIAYCSDCLTVRGSGSVVVWDGSAYQTTDGIPATTELLTYFRALRQLGRQFFSVAGKGHRVGSLPFGQTINTSSGGTNSVLGNGEAMTGSVAATGGQVFVGATDAIRLGGSSTIPTTSAAYIAEDVFFSRASIDTDDFRYALGFRGNANAATALDNNEVLFLLDRANSFSFGNTSNSPNWCAVNRSAGTITLTVSAVEPAYTLSGRQTVEILFQAGAVNYYVGGALVATHTTNIPSGSTLSPAFALIKTSGSTAVSEYRFNLYVATRT